MRRKCIFSCSVILNSDLTVSKHVSSVLTTMADIWKLSLHHLRSEYLRVSKLWRFLSHSCDV